METPGKTVPSRSGLSPAEAKVHEAIQRMDAQIAEYQALSRNLSNRVAQMEGALERLNTKPFIPYTNEFNTELFQNMSEAKRLAKMAEIYRRDLASIQPLLSTMQHAQKQMKRYDMADAKFETAQDGAIRGANEHGNFVVEALATFTVADFYASAASWKAAFRNDVMHELVPVMSAPGAPTFSREQILDITRRGKDYLDVLERQMNALTKAGGAKNDYINSKDMQGRIGDFNEVRSLLSAAERAAGKNSSPGLRAIDLGAAARMINNAITRQQLADENYNKVMGEAAQEQYVHEKANWYTKLKFHVMPIGDGLAMASPLIGAGIGTLVEPGGGTVVGLKIGTDISAGWWTMRGIDGIGTSIANDQVFSMECAQNLAIIALSATRIPGASNLRGVSGATKALGAGLLVKTAYDVGADLTETADRGWVFTSGQKKQYLFYGGMFVFGALETGLVGPKPSNKGIFTASLQEARKNVPYAEISSIWKRMQNDFREGMLDLEAFNKTVKEPAKGMQEHHLSNQTLLVLDKGKTWLLNNLGKEFGDLGLKIYFEALNNVAMKFENPATEAGAKRSNKLLQYRTTAEGDEAVLLLSGENAGRGREITDALGAEMARVAKKYGVNESSPIFKAITGFSSHEARIGLRIENGEVMLYERSGERYAEKPMSLDQAIMNAEVKPLLEKLPPASRAPVEGFMGTAMRLGEMLGLKGEKPENVPKDVACERHLQIRLSLDSDVSAVMLEVAEVARKAVSQIKLNMVGPSFLNLMGHSVTDALGAVYFELLRKNMNQAGVDAEIYSTGPMSFGFKGRKKTDWSGLDGAIEATNKEFTGLIHEQAGKELGITGVDYALGTTKWEAGKKFISKLPGLEKTSDYQLNNIRNAISLFHLRPGSHVQEALGKVAMTLEQRDNLRNSFSSLPEWARDETGIYLMLKLNGLEQGQISQVFQNMANVGRKHQLDVKLMVDAEKAKAPAGTPAYALAPGG